MIGNGIYAFDINSLVWTSSIEKPELKFIIREQVIA